MSWVKLSLKIILGWPPEGSPKIAKIDIIDVGSDNKIFSTIVTYDRGPFCEYFEPTKIVLLEGPPSLLGARPSPQFEHDLLTHDGFDRFYREFHISV